MCSVGAKVYNAGVLPTPGVAYLVRKYNFDAGVVISASHNPMQDNGIKFFSSKGYKLPDKIEDEIEELMAEGLNLLPSPVGEHIGYEMPADTALDDYVSFLKSTAVGLDLTGFKIALDCANGATYEAAPKLFTELGAQVKAIHNTPDGTNINKDCGSTHMESLVEYVKSHDVDLGLALDGDGDRLIVTDESGSVLDGDQVMSICGWYMKRNGLLHSDSIAVTIMSNLGLFKIENDTGIHFETTKVGDRYVLERMLEKGLNLGGEQSGHVIFLDYNTTGDGLVTALQLLKVLKAEGGKLSELNHVMTVMPQVLVNAHVDNTKKPQLKEHPAIKAEMNKLEQKYNGNGRVLIRASGTEPVVRVMIEGMNKAEMEADAAEFAALIEQYLG
jgi:phosphoglucosamine mutase